MIFFSPSGPWEMMVFRGILNLTMSTGLPDLQVTGLPDPRDMFLVVFRRPLGMFPENLRKIGPF